MEERVKKIFENSDQKPDVIIIKNSDEPHIDENFFYVTGLDKGLFEGSAAILFSDGRVKLLVPELEAQIAKKANAEIVVYTDSKDFYEILKKTVSSFKTVGLNFRGISLKDFLKVKNNISECDFVDVSTSFAKTRLIKDESEIKLIKRACEIVDKVVEKIPDFLNGNMYEFELAAEINYFMQKNGATKRPLKRFHPLEKIHLSLTILMAKQLLKKGISFFVILAHHLENIIQTSLELLFLVTPPRSRKKCMKQYSKHKELYLTLQNLA